MNLGCGPIQPSGWVNVDKDPAHYYPSHTGEGREAWVADVTAKLPFGDGSFDLVVMNHSLQQIPHPKLERALREVVRILADGGILRVMVPDIEAAFDARRHSRWEWFPNREATLAETFCTYLTWYGTNVTGFNDSYLRAMLERAGFSEVALTSFRVSRFGEQDVCELDDRAGESIFMEARR